jgi:hypothetical protein
MNQKGTTAQSRIVLIIAFVLCAFLGVGLLLTAVSFGIERSDLDANPHVRVQDQLRLHRAANVATLGCVFLEIAATWALVKISSRGTISRIKAGTRASLAFIGLSILSYSIVVAALMGFALDPLLSVQRTLDHWILVIVG